MAYIYVITNGKNGKQYVGKTEKVNALDRFYEHIKDSQSETKEKRPLYNAFNKYGVENFEFEILEEVDSDKSEEREIYWINTLNTYGSTGYNATLGGDGRTYLNHDKIVEDYKKSLNMSEVAILHDCHVTSVKNILQSRGIDILSSQEVNKTKYGKPVNMLDKKTGKVLKTFASRRDAGRYLLENGYSNCSKVSSVATKIGLVIKGERQTTGGFKWE